MNRLFYALLILIALTQCAEEHKGDQLSTPGKSAESVYVTHDHQDNPVIAWTERDSNELMLYFAVSFDNGKSFSEKRALSLLGDVATHAEGMPKIAFSKNGTIIVAYEKKAPTKENKYAGAIYYVMSDDQGRTWTAENFLHNDTVAGRSRSYFDIERLPDGEVGASWLDIKLNDDTGGRSVRFAKTSEKKGFTNEVLVDSSACQCCRLDVYQDIAGQVNIAYRGLMHGKMGQAIRDMMLATSRDNGKSFSRPAKISQDNWVIDGCPHTGPSLCSNKAGLYSLSYTEGNGTGIYYNFKSNADSIFTQRELVSGSGHHPQASASETRFIMVWEENSNREGKQRTTIFYQMNKGNEVVKKQLSPDRSNAYLPVVTQTHDGFLVAFLMDTDTGAGIFTTHL